MGVMRIKSEEEFQAAMSVGVPHIVIEQHLDLRGFATLPGNPPTLFRLNPHVRSLQVTHQQTLVSAAANVGMSVLLQLITSMVVPLHAQPR